MMFLSQNAPEGGRAAAQGDIATANSLMMAAASALSGVLYGMGGERRLCGDGGDGPCRHGVRRLLAIGISGICRHGTDSQRATGLETGCGRDPAI